MFVLADNASATVMESQMESIDISSIRAAALQPLKLPQTDSEDHSRNDRLKSIQTVFQQPAAVTNPNKCHLTHQHQNGTTSQPVRGSEYLPDLPSTVPESQAVANVEKSLQEISNASLPQVMSVLKKMSSQGAPQDTQPLSPAFIEGLISKSRRSDVYAEETGFTHGTLHSGDEGHIDLMSSYPHDGVVVNDQDESEIVHVDFSPTQSGPTRLSQFPESQRFKTPATVGKKRNYNGDTVESPALPRNPLARNGEPASSRMMGLSQVFDATQAASSPFVNHLPSELRSDRPSPAFAIQPRPNTATESSPILARPLLPRSSTEPQTRYTPMDESQAIREARKRMEMDGVDEEDSDDSFDETPAEARRRREKRRRNEEAQRQFNAVASYRKNKASWSSPVRSSEIMPRCSSPYPTPALLVGDYLHPDPTSPPKVPEDIANASEEETDQENEDEVAVRLSSQMRLRAVPEEDKENAPHGAVQIPETAALHRVMNGYAAEIEASPSIRHSNEVIRSHPSSQRPEDGETFVANSQPSQVRRYAIHGPRLASSGEQTDFVPQSQYPSNSNPEEGRRLGELAEVNAQNPPTQGVQPKPNPLVSQSDTRSSVAETAEETRPMAEDDEEVEDDKEEPPRRNLRSQAGPQPLSSTITETSSARRRGGVPSSADPRVDVSKGTSEFETAPTHFLSSTDHDSAPAVPPSLAPVAASPVRKRMKMTDIDAEASQTRSSGPDLGELNPILIDREYNDFMGSSSPIRPGRYAKRRRMEVNDLKARQQGSSSPMAPSASDRRHSSMGKDASSEQEPRTTQGETPPASSDDIREPVPRTRGLGRRKLSASRIAFQSVATYGKTRNKPSAWDIQASPEEPTLMKSANRVTSLRKPPLRFSPAEPRPDSGSHLLHGATQHTRTKRSKDIEPIASISRQLRAEGRLRVPELTLELAETNSERVSTLVCGAKDCSAPPGEIIFPNQVLACYNGKARAYYPATCLGVSGTETLRYQIQWDGYEPDEIDKHGVRSLDLRHGDSIKINLEGFPKTPHVIRGFKDKITDCDNAVTDVRGYKTLLVAPKQRKSLPVHLSIDPEEVKDAPVSAIYLDSNMWNQMKDRNFTYIVPPSLALLTRTGHSTPMDRPSTPSTPSSRTRRPAASAALLLPAPMSNGSGCFANMAFAISYESSVRKTELTSLIVSKGGLVLTSGFHELFRPETMVLRPQYANLGFTALLADKHSRKEKYLQALALDLPCLSGKWIETCAANQVLVEWQSYLLPAGESDELEGAVRSRVLPIYDATAVSVVRLIESRPNILQSGSVIFVLGRGKAEEKRRPYVFLTQALGAGRIEKVADIRAAKILLDRANLNDYKWVFVDDRDVETATALLETKVGKGTAEIARVQVVGNEFVKQSLVLGRMFGGL